VLVPALWLGLSTGVHAGEPISGTVVWQPPGGELRTLAFQGTQEGDAVHGTLNDGERPVAVQGTVGPDGLLSGTVTAPDGAVLGTFQMAPPQPGDPSTTVAGTYATTSQADAGVWVAAEGAAPTDP
jgi:hypothetical protein